MNISDRARELVWRAERELQKQFQRIDAVEAAWRKNAALGR